MRAAILQSNYIPWKGYFDLIGSVDDFVLYDTAKYTKNDWRNRNRIKTAQGPVWLTIPIERSAVHSPICAAKVTSQAWRGKHWRALSESYAKSRFFSNYRGHLEELYLTSKEDLLSQINFRLIAFICGVLGISTRFHWSNDFTLPEGRVDKLVAMCQQLGAGTYVSGPAAHDYIGEPPNAFSAAGIEVEYFDYSGYPEHRQLFPPFEHSVTVLDLIFNEGERAPMFMKWTGMRASESSTAGS
jgi:hypothetical protein